MLNIAQNVFNIAEKFFVLKIEETVRRSVSRDLGSPGLDFGSQRALYVILPSCTLDHSVVLWIALVYLRPSHCT